MNNVISYLLNYAFDHQVGYTLTYALPSDIPSCALPKRGEIMINMNWHNQKELPFQVAHEIGHVLNGDTGIRYYESTPTRSKSEHDANIAGINLLIQYCDRYDIDYSNSVKFAESFGIPTYLEPDIREEIAKHLLN